MDDQELDRIDLCHTKYYALLEKKSYLAPISENPQRIMDLGCGTGEANASVSSKADRRHRHMGRGDGRQVPRGTGTSFNLVVASESADTCRSSASTLLLHNRNGRHHLY